MAVPFLMLSCNRKESSEEELTPLNAPKKYGKVLGGALKKSKAMDSILYMKNKINSFHVQEARYPASLNELVEKGHIEKLPELPEGMRFVYDPSTGKIDAK